MELLLPLLIVVLFGLMVMQMVRQRKTMKQVQELQNDLQPGDLVMTTAGLHAKVVETSEATLDLEIAPGVVSTWDRRVIRERLTPQEPTAAQDLGTKESPENPDGPTGPDSEK